MKGKKHCFFACVLVMVVISFVLSMETECSTEKRPRGKVVVNCNFQDLTSFPRVIDEEVNGLNVVFNRIAEVPKTALSHLLRLTQFNLTHNLLTEVNPQLFRGLWKLQSIDLSYNRLTVLYNHTFHNLTSLRWLKLDSNRIPALNPASFEGLTHLLSVDLGNNQLQVLANNTFRHLQDLTQLSLVRNNLNKLEAGAFFGLNNLTFLDVSSNRLDMSSSALPPGVFAPLGQLEDLRIENNSRASSGVYPDNVFSDLVFLRRLTIDTFYDMHFGKDFAALGHIETLDLTNYCGVGLLSNNSLEGFKNSTLSALLFDCPLLKIELCVFCDLPHLKRLVFLGGSFTIPTKIIEALYGLQHQTMSEISLINVGRFLPMYHVIDSRVGKYIHHICVSTFRIVNCRIQRVTSRALTTRHFPLSKCVEHVDLSYNSLLGDVSTFLHLFTFSSRLRTLSLQGQSTFTFDRAKCLIDQNYECKEDLINDRYNVPHVILPFPQNLTYLNISSLFPHLNPLPQNITIRNGKQLKTLDMSYLGLAYCSFTVFSLENIETFSLEGNICKHFADTAFDLMPNLRRLSLSSMLLDPDFVSTRAKRVFQNLTKLQVLDLSLNNLLHVNADMLQTQTDLRELDLGSNRLQSVSIDLQYHRELRRLDLRKNMMTTLTLSERRALDELADRHHFRLLLQGNPLACSCFNLDVVPWLWHTKVQLDGDGRPANYTCTTEKGEVTSTEVVMAQWLERWRGCVGGQIFSIALSAFLVQILLLTIAFFISRSWTQLYYAWRAIRNLRLPRRQNFWKDAYLVYADADDDVSLACLTLRQILEERHGVRLLLRNRDEVGGHIAENIVQHIDDSWKVVLLVTQAFSQDDWACGFAVTQAQRSISANMPDRVIVLFFEDPSRLPAMPPLQMLLRMVPEKNILYVRPGTPQDHDVWKILADMILDEPLNRRG